MIKEIGDNELTLGDIPPCNATWDVIGEFALTFNGYKTSFETCAQIANEHRHGSLEELRTCLFFEQRRWRHYGREPDEEAMTYIRSVVEEIREHVSTRKS